MSAFFSRQPSFWHSTRKIAIFALVFLLPSISAWDTKTKWTWVDSSCNGHIGELNTAGEEVMALVTEAYAAVTQVPLSKNTETLLLNFFGIDPTTDGRLGVERKFLKLKTDIAETPMPYGLYCDGSAFRWVTTWQESSLPGAPNPHGMGDPLPGGGKFFANRRPPTFEPIYFDGAERNDVCQTPPSMPGRTGKAIQGITPRGQNIVIMCPSAFGNEGFYKDSGPRALGNAKNEPAADGTNIDKYASTGDILLHELTHAVLRTIDVKVAKIFPAYEPEWIIALGTAYFNRKTTGYNAPLYNANTFSTFALAIYLNKNSWVTGKAQSPITDAGPAVPAAKKRHIFQNPIPRVMRAFISQSDLMLARAVVQTSMRPKPKPLTGRNRPQKPAKESQQKAATGGPTVIQISDGQIQVPVSTQTSNPLPVPSCNSMGSMYIPGYFQAGSLALTGDPTAGFDVDGTTVKPGGPTITVSGNTIALQPSGQVVIDGSTERITTVTVGPLSQPTVTALLTQTVEGNGVVACIPELTVSSKSTITQCRGSWRATISPGSLESHKPATSSVSTKSHVTTKASPSKDSTKSALPIIPKTITRSMKPSAPGTKPNGLTSSSDSSDPSDSIKPLSFTNLIDSTKKSDLIPTVNPTPSQILPADASVVFSTSGTVTFKETFELTTYSRYISLTKPTVILTRVAPGRSESLVIGPGGIGWVIPSLSSGQPQLNPPTNIPSARSSQVSKSNDPSASIASSRTQQKTGSSGISHSNVIPSTRLTATASNGQLVTTVVPPISITTTITTSPPGFTYSTTSNTAFVSNTVITVSGTMYPVLVGCSICGPPGTGLILIGLGGVPADPPRSGCGGGGLLGLFRSFFSCGTDFIIPGLPSFYLDIDGIPEPGPGPDPGEDPSPQNPSISSPKPSTGKGSTTKKSTTSTGSSCSSTRTASDCNVICTATASTQRCSTTCYHTMTGCGLGVTSTVTGTATDVGYVDFTEQVAFLDVEPYTIDSSIAAAVSAEDASLLSLFSNNTPGKTQSGSSGKSLPSTHGTVSKTSSVPKIHSTKSGDVTQSLSHRGTSTSKVRPSPSKTSAPHTSPTSSKTALPPIPSPTCGFSTETSFSLQSFHGALPFFCAFNQPISVGQLQQYIAVDCSRNTIFTLSVAYKGGPDLPSSMTIAAGNGVLCAQIFTSLLTCQQPVQGIYSGGDISYEGAVWTLGPIGEASGQQCPQNTVPPIVCKSVEDCKCPQNLGSCIQGNCYCSTTPISVSLDLPAIQTIEACFNDPIDCVFGDI